MRLPRVTTETLPPRDAPSSAHATFGALTVLADFATVSLSEVDALSLQDRVDTKYLLHLTQLSGLLTSVEGAYRVLEINGPSISPYETIYFDTSDFALYQMHHARTPRRSKIRSRHYQINGQCFVEVKSKGKRDRTIKRRARTDGLVKSMSESNMPRDFAASLPIEAGALEPKLSNSFWRITLAGKEQLERVTIDLEMAYKGNGRRVMLPEAVIIEVKQAGVSYASPFVAALRRLTLHPLTFSKYCIGVALLFDDVKHNEFKPQLLALQRLKGGEHGSERFP
jgi:hypothetical protein